MSPGSWRLARLRGDRELAVDLAQETFARTLERGHRVKLPSDGSAWPWLWTVARNLLRDRQRRDVADAGARRRLGIASVAFDEHAIEDLISRVDPEELREPLALALDGLPTEQSEAVVGRVVFNHDYNSLADDLGTTEQALRVRVSRGLRALRMRLSGGRP